MNPSTHRISERSQKLLRELASQGKARNWLPWLDRRIELITALGESGEPALIPYLTSFALTENKGVQIVTCAVIDKLISSIPLIRLSAFDMHARASTSNWNFHAKTWPYLQPSRVKEFSGPCNAGMLFYASMHGNGRVREAALRILENRSDGRELPYLLLRANDWVPSIRDRARRAIEARIHPSYAAHLLRCLPLILRLDHCQRVSHRWIEQAIQQLFASRVCLSVLQEGLRSPDPLIRRMCLTWADASDQSVLRMAFLTAASDSVPVIRLIGVLRLIKILQGDELIELCQKLALDPFMPVRREALVARVNARDPLGRKALLDSLLDRNFAMRECACFHLKPDFDFARFYRESLTRECGPRLTSAILGLGERGTSTDVEELIPYLDSPAPSLRKAALIALSKLDGPRFKDIFLSALSDSSPGVAKAAAIALRPVISKSDAPRLLEILRGSGAARKKAFHLAFHLGKWDQITVFLAALRDQSGMLASLSQTAIQGWMNGYNRDFSSPSPEQLARATRELRQSQDFLDSEKLKHLEFFFSGWNS